MKLSEAALNYARRGIPVFPVHGINDNGDCTCNKPDCAHPGKHPIHQGGYKIATKDEHQITDWWEKNPQANIGVPTGETSGWYVVDIDKKSDGIDNYKKFVEQYKDEISEATLKVRTGGGGYHLMYGPPVNGQAIGSGTRIGGLDGVDFRGDKGYIVVPPSKHHSRNRYKWDAKFTFNNGYDLAKLQPLPQPIVDLMQLSSNKPSSQKIIHEGGRNDHLFQLACRYRRDGIADDKLFDFVLEKNESVCKPPLDAAEVQKIVASALKTQFTSGASEDSIDSPDNVPTLEKGSGDLLNKIMALTAGHEFWVDEAKKQFVTFEVDNKPTSKEISQNYLNCCGSHYENWPIQSQEYRQFLQHKYRQLYNKIAPKMAMNNALETLAGDALFNGICNETYVRTARFQDSIVIDLTDQNWRWIEITASSWSIRSDKSPVKFLRSANVKPMFTPDPSGSFNCLSEVFRLNNQDDYLLLAAWMMFVLLPNGPYVILILEGVAGSSKSTLTKQIRQLVDPRKPVLQGLPHNVDDLFVQANSGHLIALDNLSEVKQKLSDVLCGISSGTGASKRELYTNMEEICFEVCKPIILNSINPVVSSPDLSDRSIRLSLPPITSSNATDDPGNHGRLSAEEVDEKFQQLAPKILGAIFNAIQAALPNYKRVSGIPAEIRMTGFAQWGFAAGKTLPLGKKDFIQVLLANRQHNAEPFMENNMLNMAVLTFMQKKHKWSGTPTELINELKKIITPEEISDITFPRTASHLTRSMNKSITTLKQFGIRYQHNASSHKNRTITLSYNPVDPNDEELDCIPATWGYLSDDSPDV